MANAFESIAFQARIKPETIAVVHPWAKVTYRQLIADVEDLCREFEARGLSDAGLVAIQLPRAYFTMVCVLAALRMGVPAATVGRSVVEKASDGLLAEQGFTHLISMQTDVAVTGLRSVRLAHNWRDSRQSSATAAVPAPRAAPAGVQWVTFSSGTTGLPKGVAISPDAFDKRLEDSMRWYDLSSQARVLTLIDFTAGPGFWWALATLAAGGRYFLPPLAALEKLFDFVEEHHITHFLTSPYNLRQTLAAGRALPSLRRLEAQGSDFPPELANRVRVKINPNVYFQYGATEVGSIATSRISRDVAIRHGAGYVRPDVRLEIVDEQGQPVPAGTPGRIRAWSRSICSGYLGEASSPSLTQDWFYPGDIGTLDPDGLLRILGRADDLMNLGGKKVSPAEIERLLGANPLVTDVAAFPMTDRLGVENAWVAIVAPKEFDADKALADLRARTGYTIARALLMDSIPRTDNGKIIKRELLALAANVQNRRQS